MKSWATRAYPDLWLIFLGVLFIIVPIFMPKGIVGLPGQIRSMRERWRRKKPADPSLSSIEAALPVETPVTTTGEAHK
jgi:hypothetical protein